ncbi:signal transduction histidine kinase [Phyllobacterium sp. 1468]|uniref:sensor histidine kinase n=1 Tax=Phyllobacterium sp. 1468 TaxID=2817759 RepID=UPI002860FB53|nr:ATP-binding protein [Phyllobacterium sp. 1468]MDR6631553.1 signal transduction histidine kinase [Phyllobacterium sp. 1468]
MAILGEWLSSQIAANQLRSRVEAGALYVEGFLARHVEETEDGPRVAADRQKELDELLIGTELSTRVEGFRIWGKDGSVIYSTDKSLMGKRLPSTDIDKAFAGAVVSQLEVGHNDEGDITLGDNQSLIEIYAPIYRPGSHDVIAVGELYEDAEEFIVQRNRVQRHTWAIVGATTLAIMGLLFLIVRRASNVIESQRVRLKSQLANAQALAEQNKKLRKAADHARMDATKSNETLLNRIGSDLHDGPVQLLSLLILRLGGGFPDPTKGSDLLKNVPQELHPSRLASQVLTELRELSTGLVLPEIENMSLEAALRVAVERHEYATGSVVSANYVGLPENVAYPLKICLYRVVQEGLNNAFRHASGLGQKVTASADEKTITVVVSDAGPGPVRADGASVRTRPLGLQGIRNRVEAFGGSVQFQQRSGNDTQLIVSVSLESNSP